MVLCCSVLSFSLLFACQAKQQLTVQDELFYYQLACSCFNEALAGNTVSVAVLRAYADVLMEMELAQGRAVLDSRTARRIAELYIEGKENNWCFCFLISIVLCLSFVAALRIRSDDWMVLRQYGVFLVRCGQFEDAKLAFLQSIQVCPNQEAVQRYCSLLGAQSEEASEMVNAWDSYRAKQTASN